MGVPTKFNYVRIRIILRALAAGYPKRVAAGMAGVAVDTLRQWELNFPKFRHLVERAHLQGEALWIRRLGTEPDSAKWALARQYGWSETSIVQVAEPVVLGFADEDAPPQTTDASLPDPEVA